MTSFSYSFFFPFLLPFRSFFYIHCTTEKNLFAYNAAGSQTRKALYRTVSNPFQSDDIALMRYFHQFRINIFSRLFFLTRYALLELSIFMFFLPPPWCNAANLNEYLVVKCCFDTAENEPSKVWPFCWKIVERAS